MMMIPFGVYDCLVW